MKQGTLHNTPHRWLSTLLALSLWADTHTFTVEYH